ncbi:glucosamine-6-phosphate deaminase [Spirosoma montaniterrae]|uniref:Glucosamine-6-phosphate deaminase n=1 Tax=Spirosoma montaniterrae TaxID=1178516 RepID=A0A1P9WS71_9BACT|nr:glucosamine-6-phosphate deaminase [Spirosoma montaniterrae]AQG78217.1 glucosamine-6-phosphate deaminase [Spirosoma montaniterrae]
MLTQSSTNRLILHQFNSRTDLGEQAARAVSTFMRELLKQQATVHMIFAAAPSQEEFLAALVTQPDLDWSRVDAFHMDEYVGLPNDAAQRFGNFLKERIFDRVPFRSVHYLDGNAPDLVAECQRYSELLEHFPVDIVCMGIGENCHIAFNDPHVADFDDPVLVKVVDLDSACRQQQVNDGCFVQLDDVPTHALTLTVPALMQAPHVFCMVPGTHKAQAVYHTIHSPVSETYPSTILRWHEDAQLFIDRDSGSQLS